MGLAQARPNKQETSLLKSMECNTVSLVPRTTHFLLFSWSCIIMHRSGRVGKSGSIHYVNDIRWKRTYLWCTRAIPKLSKMVYSPPIHRWGYLVGWNSPLLHPPTPVLGPTNPPSENLGYGPVSLSSSIITTQQHGERNSKEAGRQLSSFTNLGGSANAIPCTLTPWVRIRWRKANKNSR